jgi:hypothetical protein
MAIGLLFTGVKEIKMDAELKRYNLEVDIDDPDTVEAVEEPEGYWVRFEDAKKIIEELESTIEKNTSEWSDSGADWEVHNV